MIFEIHVQETRRLQIIFHLLKYWFFFKIYSYIYICTYVSLYETIQEQNHSFLCVLFNGSKGHIFDVTMITAREYALQVALL